MPEQIIDEAIQKAHIRRMTNVMCGAVPYKRAQPSWPEVKSTNGDRYCGNIELRRRNAIESKKQALVSEPTSDRIVKLGTIIYQKVIHM